MKRNIICKTKHFYILPTFLLVTIALLIADSIYCYLKKCQGKLLLPFHNTDNKLSNFYIGSIN